MHSGDSGVYGRRGILVRLIYLAIASVRAILTGLGRLNHRRCVILCYHGVKAHQRERFAWQMRFITERAILIGSSRNHGQGAGRRLRVALTFDDGFANLLDNVLPILRELDIPAIVFPVSADLGRTPRWQMPPGHPDAHELLMSVGQLREVSGDGRCRIGSHAQSHRDLATLSPSDLIAELVDSKAELEKILDRSVEDLALPYGSYNARVLAAAQKAGYRRVFTLDPCPVDIERADGVLGRFSMSPDVWRIEFMLTCAGAYSWLCSWRNFVRRVAEFLGPAARVAPQPE